MKRFTFVVGMVVLVFAVSIWAQTQAPKPDPELKKFDVFLGHYTYEGEYMAGPFGPASKVTGDWTFGKILGGFFYQNQFTEKGASVETHGIEIIGYDAEKKSFFSNEYHDDGIMYSGVYVVSGNAWTYTGKVMVMGTPYMLKAAITTAADSMSFTVKGEISSDGKAWAPIFDMLYTKVPKPAPKK